MTSSAPLVVQRVRHELKRRDLVVTRVDDLTPHVRRITFGGDSLADFVSASFDDHVKFMLDTGDAEPVRRDYTPRSFDRERRELVIEFALHGDGPVAAWAAQAEAGQRAIVGGPRGSFVVPVDYDWHLLVGDETALPAIARRLEELPPTTRARVIAQTGDVADRRVFSSAAPFEITWVDTTEALVDAVAAETLPTGPGYAWCAGEAAAMKRIRAILVDEKGHDRKAIRASAYWKAGASGHHEDLED